MLQIVIKAGIDAGQEILKIYNSDEFDVKFKKDESPLTKADIAAHKKIVAQLETTGIPVLSEEGADIPYNVRSKWDSYWLIDPLDGTKEFINRNGEFTVNIALIKDNYPVLGVVYVPVEDKLYMAEKDKGAFILENASFSDISNKKEIKSSCVKDKKILAVSSKSHINSETLDFINNLENKGYSIERKSKGSSLKLCMVAEGLAHVYPRFGPTMEWDTAAAHAICREAGVIVKDFKSGQELIYNKENLLNNHFIVYTTHAEGIINE